MAKVENVKAFIDQVGTLTADQVGSLIWFMEEEGIRELEDYRLFCLKQERKRRLIQGREVEK